MRRLLPVFLLLPVAAALLLAGPGGIVGPSDPTDRYFVDGKPVARIGIPVGSEFAVDATELDDCADGALGTACREQAYGNLSASLGPEEALRRMRAAIASGAIELQECHMVAHKIGSGALVYHRGDFAPVISVSASDCSEGYLHGVFEPLFVETGVDDTAAFADRIYELCGPDGVSSSIYVQANCSHGAAHAVMLRSGYNLPLAIEACERAWSSEGGMLFVNCLQGAFMENFIPSYSVRSPWLRDDDLLFPCGSFTDPIVVDACFVQVGDRLALTPELTLREFAEICSRAPEAGSDPCFQGFGRTVSFRSFEAGGPDPIASCALAAPYDQEEICFWQYAASSVAGLRGSGELPLTGRVGRVCAAVTDPASRRACWQGIGWALVDNGGVELFPEGFDAIARCREEEIADPEDLRACASGMRLESPRDEGER